MATEQDLYDLVMRELRDIVASTDTHLVMAETNQPMHKLCIEPFRKSNSAICLKKRWPQELLHQGELVNTGWVEEVSTRLRVREGDEHERTPNIPSGGGAPPSLRKSSLFKFIVRQLLMRTRRLLRNGGCTHINATLKAHRASLFCHSLSGLATDEISTMYKTSLTEDVPGQHLAQRSRMPTFLSCEEDAAMTGFGESRADVYSFYHLGWGQLGPATEVYAPREGGFSKRINQVYANYRSIHNPDQQTSESKEFLTKFFEWHSRNALGEDEEPVPALENGSTPNSGQARNVNSGTARDQGSEQVPREKCVNYCDAGSELMFRKVFFFFMLKCATKVQNIP